MCKKWVVLIIKEISLFALEFYHSLYIFSFVLHNLQFFFFFSDYVLSLWWFRLWFDQYYYDIMLLLFLFIVSIAKVKSIHKKKGSKYINGKTWVGKSYTTIMLNLVKYETGEKKQTNNPQAFHNSTSLVIWGAVIDR